MIRRYEEDDLDAVLSVFRQNVPAFFAPGEESDLIDYLREEKEDYFVVVINDKIVGCGGVNYFSDEQQARISWDFFDLHFQGKGLGKTLLEFRISHIRQQASYQKIVVRTSQLAQQFYAKFGFEVQYTKADYWAEGLHLFYMELRL